MESDVKKPICSKCHHEWIPEKKILRKMVQYYQNVLS